MMNKLALILDDEPTICMLLQEILKMKNIQSVTADSIKSARLLLDKYQPELAFIDHRLPDGFGLDFVPELRSRCSGARIIVMTAQENFDLATITIYGADFFLPKPFEISKIFEISREFEQNPG